MSCFNCYSSRKIDADLIDKILERGHRLRSAMVQSILTNDPFYEDVVVHQDRKVQLDALPKETNDKIKAFLHGDAMSREDEILTLETLRSMSAVDLCKVTDRTYRSEEPCDCSTCVEYEEKDLKCDLKRDSNEITQKIQEKYKSEVASYLQFVDSMKVSVNCVILNEAGDKKVIDSLVKDKVAGVGQTFFLEYRIPDVLVKTRQKSNEKVDSGTDFGNVVRLCSRRTHSQAINFKQVSVHDITGLSKVKLEDIGLNFRLSFRNFKQKQPVALGVAKFRFSSFEVSKNFTCNQELTLRLSEKTPIVVGGLKVSIQLGCGRLYFGKEFIDAVTNNKENSVVLGSDDLSSTESDFIETIVENYQKKQSQKTIPHIPKLKLHPSKSNSDNRRTELISEISRKPTTQKSDSISMRSKVATERSESLRKPVVRKSDTIPLVHKPVSQQIESPKKPILFGFVYISEAQFSREVMNSYLTCQMFTTDDSCSSKLVPFDSNPVYNFSQQIPLLCDEDFLLKLRENFMVVEFFEKDQKDFLVGLTKLSLHQFYLAYRNPVVVKYLSERRLPVVGTDGWEFIYHPNDGQVAGQAQFLVALGTKEQIDNLERDRGCKNNNKNKVKVIPKSIDVGIQSNMEPKKDIESFLKEIVAQKSLTESRTDPSELRSTSDLLDSLHKALSIENIKEKNFFKAHVVINGALHLPSRRKCKSKRSKGRNTKNEDILPSTYVTFEDFKGELRITPIVPKSTAPKWEFRCDVALPVEFLTDNQKYLVFKVWRKSTNTTLTPNMQVDHVIGFATVDLSVLSAGLPSVQGWFNINDLSKKCNGQINIHVTPLENLTKYHQPQKCCSPTPPKSDIFEPGELLSRALKRKFTELDEVTQRLRLRLSEVTRDESDASNDEISDEFERDINTLCVEDDFDTIDFEKEARNFNMNHVKEIGLLQTDQHLVESKQKIDQMLEKLSLMSGETSSRYVSGCSRVDTESVLHEVDSKSNSNLNLSEFSREMADKFGSLLREECREVPDGEGNNEV